MATILPLWAACVSPPIRPQRGLDLDAQVVADAAGGRLRGTPPWDDRFSAMSMSARILITLTRPLVSLGVGRNG